MAFGRWHHHADDELNVSRNGSVMPTDDWMALRPSSPLDERTPAD